MTGLRRQWWVLCAGILAGVVIGVVIFVRSAPVYASTASVLVAPVGGVAVNLQTEALLVRSTEIASSAQATIHSGALADVVATQGTSVLRIRFEAPTPAAAQAGADAYAKAYLDGRARAARSDLEARMNALTAKITDANTQLAAVNARIASLGPSSTELADLSGTKTTLSAQIMGLTTKAGELSTTTINPGRVIDAPLLPDTPVRPDPLLYLPSSMLAGLVGGLAVALVRERVSRRVWHGVEVTRRHGLTVLMELTNDEAPVPARRADVRYPRPAAPMPVRTVASSTGPDENGVTGLGLISPAVDPSIPGAAYVDTPRPEPDNAAQVAQSGQHAARHHGAFNRMRNEIVAALGNEDRLLIVVGASTGAASTVVAANLAAAFARADIEVVLVGANAPEIGNESVTLSHIFDVADIPGLTDVLTGRVTLTRAMQRAARSPRLRVVTPGGTATASGLLQSEGARGALHTLRRLARFILVDAPSAAAGADAQSLAACADAAIVVAEAGRTRHSQLADATAQLRLVGTRVLGVALISRSGTTVEATPIRPSHHVARAHDLDVWLATSRNALNAPTVQLAQIESTARAHTVPN